MHHLQSHLHYHRHTCTVALNQGLWTNTNSLAGLFFNLLYYFSLVLANNYNYVNKTNFDIQAHNEKGTGNYKKAKRFGNIAIYLTLVNIIYTLFIDTLIVGLAISLRCEFLHIMSVQSSCCQTFNQSFLNRCRYLLLPRASILPQMLKDSTFNTSVCFRTNKTKMYCCCFYEHYEFLCTFCSKVN